MEFNTQVFYDFLGRIIPGATLIVITFITILGPKEAENFLLNSPQGDKLFSFGFILLWTLGSYILGFLSTHLWEITLGKLTNENDKNSEKECKAKCIGEHIKFKMATGKPVNTIKLENLPGISVMRDHLRHSLPNEALRLLKVRAERRSCQILFFGFLVLSIVNGGYLLMYIEVSRMVLEVLLFVGLIACWTGANRLHRYLVNGTTISWLYFYK